MSQLVILIGDRDAAVLDVMRRVFQRRRREGDTTFPEVVTMQKPERLLEELLRRREHGEEFVVTTSLRYDHSSKTSLDVLRACAQRMIPCVLVSGAATGDPMLHEAMQLANDYVQKPFAPDHLVEVVFAASTCHGQPMAVA